MLLQKFLNHHLFKIHECFWILPGMVELSKNPLMRSTHKKKKNPAGVYVWVQRHLDRFFVIFSLVLSPESIQSFFSLPLSLSVSVCVQTLTSLGWQMVKGAACLCVHVCVCTLRLNISSHGDQYSEAVCGLQPDLLASHRLPMEARDYSSPSADPHTHKWVIRL